MATKKKKTEQLNRFPDGVCRDAKKDKKITNDRVNEKTPKQTKK